MAAPMKHKAKHIYNYLFYFVYEPYVTSDGAAKNVKV